MSSSSTTRTGSSRPAVSSWPTSRATALVAGDAVYPAARDRLNFPEQVAAGLQPHRVSEIYIWGSERANFEVDITDVIEGKRAALPAPRSQFGEEYLERALERWKSPDGRSVGSFRRVTMAF